MYPLMPLHNKTIINLRHQLFITWWRWGLYGMLRFMEFFIGLPYFLWNQLRLSFLCRSSVFFWRVWKNSDIVSGRYFLCKDFTMATLSPSSQRKKNKIRKLKSGLLIQKQCYGLITYTILYLHNVFCLVSHTYQ